MLRITLLAFAFVALPVAAAERSVAVTNFDRIRVDGPFDVHVTTRATPNATISGDARALDRVEVRVEGGTMIVRTNNANWGERPVAKGIPAPVIRVQTRDLRSAAVVGSGTLTIAGPVAADRVELTVTGAGALTARAVAAGMVGATVIGTGQITLGGAARSARLVGSGAGEIAARDLVAGDVAVRTEGSTAVTVTARFTATANSSGLGPIEILGEPECRVKAQADGPISCAGRAR